MKRRSVEPKRRFVKIKRRNKKQNEETMKYKRILLKLSGESLMGEQEYGISPDMLAQYAGEIKSAKEKGAEIAVVIGGGNIFRGLQGAA